MGDAAEEPPPADAAVEEEAVLEEVRKAHFAPRHPGVVFGRSQPVVGRLHDVMSHPRAKEACAGDSWVAWSTA